MATKKKPNVVKGKVTADGWVNFLTGLGVEGKDKREAAIPKRCALTYQGWSALYDCSDLAKRIVDLPAEDMTREPFELRVPEDDEVATEVEGILEELETLSAFEEAIRWRRLYGGSIILIGADDGSADLSRPLNENAIKRIDYLNVFDAFEARQVEWNQNPASKGFGEPTMFQLNPHVIGSGLSAFQRVHASRCLMFCGTSANRKNRMYANASIGQGWGDSELLQVVKIIRDFDSAWGGASALLTDFAQAVYKLNGLAAAMLSDKEDVIKKRLAIINLSRSMINAMIMDKDGEDFERKATPMSGMSETLSEFKTRVAAAARMPVTKLFGISPGGLNATGASDERNWFDYVRAMQIKQIKKQASQLHRLILLSKEGPTSGKEPDKWACHFPSLWQLTDAEKAEVRNKNAQSDQIYSNLGVASAEDIAKSRFGGPEYGMDLVIDLNALDDREEMAAEAAQAGHEATIGALESGGTPPGVNMPKPPTKDEIVSDFLKEVPGGWVVMNSDGSKVLSKVYKSKKEAAQRLSEIEYFKHKG